MNHEVAAGNAFLSCRAESRHLSLLFREMLRDLKARPLLRIRYGSTKPVLSEVEGLGMTEN
jgi:hypothetical protein